MSFINTELASKLKKQEKDGGTVYTNAEFLTFYWLTNEATYRRLLPYPLKPLKEPLVSGFVAHYPEVTQLFPYNEYGLSLICKYKGKIGKYWLSMGLTDDVAVYFGREIYGFPKKVAKVFFMKNGLLLEGWGERREKKIFTVTANLTGKMNDPLGMELINKYDLLSDHIRNYNFKELLSTSPSWMDYFPALTACAGKSTVHDSRIGEAKLILLHHPYDPWHEVSCETLLGASYSKVTNVLTFGKKIYRIKPWKFKRYLPHMFKKYDIP